MGKKVNQSSSEVEEFLQTERDTFLLRNGKNDQGRMASQNQCFQVCWDRFPVFGSGGIPSAALWEVLTCTDHV